MKKEVTKKLSKHIPVSHFADELIINKNGNVTAGYRLLLPELYTVTDEENLQIQEMLMGVANILEEGVRLHFQNIYYQDVYHGDVAPGDSIAVRHNKLYFEDKMLLKNYCNLYVTFPYSKLTSAKRDTLYKPMDYFTRSIPEVSMSRLKEMGEQLQQLAHMIEGASNVEILRMSTENLQIEFAKIYNLDFGNDILDSDDIAYNPAAYDGSIGSNLFKVLRLVQDGETLTDFKASALIKGESINEQLSYKPNRNINTSYMFPIGAGLPVPHIVNTIIEICENEKVKKEIKSKIGLYGKVAKIVSSVKARIEDLEDFSDALNDTYNRVSKFHVNVVITDTNADRLTRMEGIVKNAFQNMSGARVAVENKNALFYHYSNLPGNCYALDQMLYTTSARAACYVPAESHYYNDRSGYLFLDPFGNPIQVNLRNPKYTNSANGFIFGKTGWGKSHLIQNMLDNALSIGEDAVIINTKDDYVKFTDINKGQYISADKMGGINPFICQRNNGQYAPLSEDYDMILEMIELIWKGEDDMSQEEKAIVRESLIAYYQVVNEEQSTPNFNGWYESLELFQKEVNTNRAYQSEDGKSFLDFSSLKLTTKEFYKGGPKEHVLNSASEINLINNRLTCFDLGAVTNNQLLFKLYLTYCFTVSTRKIFANAEKGIFTNVIVDECIDSMQGKGGHVIGQYFRKNRSMGASVMISTQDVKYMKALPDLVKDSISSNAQIKVILGDLTKDSKEYLVQNMGFTPNDIKLNENCETDMQKPYREFVLKIGNKTRILRSQVSDYTNAVYTTSKTEVNQIKELFHATGSMQTAIDLFVQEKYEN